MDVQTAMVEAPMQTHVCYPHTRRWIGYTWENLPEKYRQSPYLTLDSTVGSFVSDTDSFETCVDMEEEVDRARGHSLHSPANEEVEVTNSCSHVQGKAVTANQLHLPLQGRRSLRRTEANGRRCLNLHAQESSHGRSNADP